MSNENIKKQVEVVKDKKERDQFDPDLWFTNADLYFIPESKQRSVILNPGFRYEKTKVLVPGKGEIAIYQTAYIPDLPINQRGKIIAVTGTRQKGKPVQPKQIGEFYELFEDMFGRRIFTNPSEYESLTDGHKKDNNNKRKVPNSAQRVSPALGELESARKVLRRLKDGHTSKNS